jgi:hypothetical protein
MVTSQDARQSICAEEAGITVTGTRIAMFPELSRPRSEPDEPASLYDQ